MTYTLEHHKYQLVYIYSYHVYNQPLYEAQLQAYNNVGFLNVQWRHKFHFRSLINRREVLFLT